jgi:hypothetical protein
VQCRAFSNDLAQQQKASVCADVAVCAGQERVLLKKQVNMHTSTQAYLPPLTPNCCCMHNTRATGKGVCASPPKHPPGVAVVAAAIPSHHTPRGKVRRQAAAAEHVLCGVERRVIVPGAGRFRAECVQSSTCTAFTVLLCLARLLVGGGQHGPGGGKGAVDSMLCPLCNWLQADFP